MALEPLVLLNDEPVRREADDGLGLLPYAKVVAGAAVGTTGPFNIGVFANWGQGKTSVLRLSEELIKQNSPDTVAVWFNAWQYEKEEHLIVPLVATIARAIEERIKTTLAADAVEQENEAVRHRWKSIHRALRSFLYGVTLPWFSAKDAIDRDEALRVAESDEYEELDPSLYFDAFAQLSALAGGEDSARIVVFVDDLDRCLPDKALAVLEGIKLALSQPGFIFVLAVDRRIVEGFLIKRYQEKFGVEDYRAAGTSYLDKLVQLPVYVPPHDSRFDEYVARLLDGMTDPSNSDIAQVLKRLKDPLKVGSAANPRTLVRLINALIVDRSVWNNTHTADHADQARIELFVVSRVVQQQLGERDFRFLVRSVPVCKSLAEGEGPLAARLQETEAGRKWVGRVKAALEQQEFFSELLQTDAGRAWLTKPAARKEVAGFLAEQQHQESPETMTQRGIIADEIRERLDLADDADPWSGDLGALTTLGLSDTRVTDAGLELLKSLTALTILGLDTTQVTDAGLEHLKSLTALTTLSLSYTQVTDAGLEHLKSLTALTSLGLSYTQVTDAGLELLKSLTTLTTLGLSDTQVTDAGLEHLKSLTALTSLGLDTTQVTDAGLEHLKSLTALTILGLTGTQVTDAGLEHLKSLTALTTLYVIDTQVTDAGVKDLMKDLPSLRAYSVNRGP